MKNNRMTKMAAILLALVLITSCFAGGTFAKYVTEGGGADAARVAKWGVAIEALEDGMFQSTYATDDEAVISVIANSVLSTEDVVAPGTSGNLSALNISGTPEVAVRLSYDADLSLDGWIVGEETVVPGEPIGEWKALGWTKIEGTSVDFPPNSQIPEAPAVPGTVNGEIAESDVLTWFHYAKQSQFVYRWEWVLEGYGEPTTVPAPFYCPIVITVGETAYSGLDYDSAADFEAAIEAAIEASSADYAPGTDLSEAAAPNISWSWAFESGNDAYDTMLGDAEVPATISCSITATATQID